MTTINKNFATSVDLSLKINVSQVRCLANYLQENKKF